MRKLISVVGIFAALVLIFGINFTSAFASRPKADHGNLLVHPQSGALRPDSGSGPLVYHTDGVVQTGTHNTYAIYWGSKFSANYKSLINGYFANVAADSGKTTNVYYSDTQYYQTIGGVTTYISYSEHFGGSWSDTTMPRSNGCSSKAGGPICVSDAQIQAEVDKAIRANNWPGGLGAEYFVFLGDGISTCYYGSECAFSYFCAYHSHYGSGGRTVLYANMPYTGHNLSACGSGNYPNGDAAADATLNVTSHEANETITDPLGNAWFDSPLGFENGDKCSWIFGRQLGGSRGAQYNQIIGSGHYELQLEWSNYSNQCVQTGK